MYFADFVSGSLAGACGVAVGYPLDTVKVRIQTQKQFTGIWQCTASTFAKEGVRGFFKGMTLPLTTLTMTSSVLFGTYRNCLEHLRRLRGAGGGPNTKFEVFLSGFAGGVAQILVMAPGDMIKVRLQCQTESKQGGVGMLKARVEQCDAGRRTCRNGSLGRRHAHGRDQSPPADGRRTGGEKISGCFPLHFCDCAGGGSRRVLQEFRPQLPACVSCQHGGVSNLRALHEFAPSQTRRRRPNFWI
ncbi:solute carrier family 25 member 47-A isoform X2 [Thalassophryne amazonica]|uniref:solute carrier family 25 member 47-A isoform X2 n=1 Tax=Thalassophryne amazonica TaxID=390379 RepID=UPI001472295A|nr:solute carrier family 25 member 47-A isoform X2 [Thalassophryne amazonica]